jgi:hypothetical protein
MTNEMKAHDIKNETDMPKQVCEQHGENKKNEECKEQTQGKLKKKIKHSKKCCLQFTEDVHPQLGHKAVARKCGRRQRVMDADQTNAWAEFNKSVGASQIKSTPNFSLLTCLVFVNGSLFS